MSLDKPSFLQNESLKLLFFGGKGGVGKTTCAAATALQLAQKSPQNTFLLVSTDPAHSLQDRLVAVTIPENLQVLELDAQALLVEFKKHYAEPLQQIAARGTFLEETDIQPLVELSLPGLDELMGFLQLTDWINEGQYQTIVVDTAPTGHTLRLLDMPLFLTRWLQALDALLAKHRYMRRVLTRRITYDELDQFLLHLADKIQQLKKLLYHSDYCNFAVVLLAEYLSYQETKNLLNTLSQRQIAVTDIVFNQCVASDNGVFSQQQQIYQRFMKEFAQTYHIWQKPSVTNIATQLPYFWRKCPFNSALQDKKDISIRDIIVQQAAPLPSENSKLHFFVGKGGVGKTTLACATALYWANQWQDKKVLLFSTDPAHSLVDCLGIVRNGTLSVVQKNLAAVEIHPDESFNQLKQKYGVEIKNVFDSFSRRLDLPFEREAMQALLELSPSGIDEVMALTTLIDYLDYDLIIIDSAPTGHFIRLLELPDLINQWLKAIFRILLKYKQVLSLPTINIQLVQLSKNVKKLQNLLQQSTTTQISIVSTLAQLAFAETRDLVAACQRLNLPITRLFLNKLTANKNAHHSSSNCFLKENDWKLQYQHAFPDLPQTLVYAGSSPQGIEALLQLGQKLYREPYHASKSG